MYWLVVRWPGAASIVAWTVMLVVALGFVAEGGNTGTHAWMTAVVLLLVLSCAVAAWYVAYQGPALAGGGRPERAVEILYGLIVASFVVAGILVVFGAGLFTVWIAYAASTAQFSWYAGRLRAYAHGAEPAAEPPGRRPVD